jgi:hypothetical protein
VVKIDHFSKLLWQVTVEPKGSTICEQDLWGDPTDVDMILLQATGPKMWKADDNKLPIVYE